MTPQEFYSFNATLHRVDDSTKTIQIGIFLTLSSTILTIFLLLIKIILKLKKCEQEEITLVRNKDNTIQIV
jgi:hypothetical protein